MRQLVSELLIAKEKARRSRRHLDNLRVRLDRFAAVFGDREAWEPTGQEIADWLYGLKLSPTSTDNFRRVLLNLFNFAMRHRFRDDNPAKLTEKPSTVATPPGILTPQELSRLLSAVGQKAPSLLPMVTIGAFAGLRSAEIARLDWKEVRLDAGVIEVTAGKSKTASRRLVHISPNLRAWLAPLKLEAGPIVPKNARKLFDAARRHAQLLANWPDNALRHSFASYHLAQHRDAARTTLELGHTSAAIVHKHYKELVLPVDAEKWWSIAPDEEAPENVIPITRDNPHAASC